MARPLLFALSMCVAYSAVVFAQKVISESDDTVDFKKFKTFAVRDGQMNSPGPALNNELTKKRIQTAIESRGVIEREEVPARPRGLRTRVERVPAIEGNLKYPPKK